VAALDQPLDLAQRAGDDAFYVAEKRGRVRVVRAGFVQPDPVLDLTSEVTTTGAEQGLLGITFSPDGNFLYAAFNNRSSGDCTLWEYRFHDGKADISTKRELLSVDHSEFSNHNGGHIAFGPDGMLYYGLGDGGSGNDPHNNAQNLNVLLGKILRIDPKPSGSLPYTIPSDNPFAGRSDARGEIWEYGLRNPWRWSFDRLTKDVWIGDVGQNTSEEIDFLPRDIAPGANLGWSAFEGSQRTPGKVGATEPANPVSPVYEYPTSDGCAVTGGYVYRGAKIAALQGVYVFGDYCNGTVQGLRMDGRKVVEHRALELTRAEQLASFGEDRDGELYVLSLTGTLYRIDPA
jgi:glucose/arabinose dehydrogenase